MRSLIRPASTRAGAFVVSFALPWVCHLNERPQLATSQPAVNLLPGRDDKHLRRYRTGIRGHCLAVSMIAIVGFSLLKPAALAMELKVVENQLLLGGPVVG